MVNEYEPSFLGGYILEVKVKVYRTQFYLVISGLIYLVREILSTLILIYGIIIEEI